VGTKVYLFVILFDGDDAKTAGAKLLIVSFE
jgi:hypothetical protein